MPNYTGQYLEDRNIDRVWYGVIDQVADIWDNGGYMLDEDKRNPRVKPLDMVKHFEGAVKEIIVWNARENNMEDAITPQDVPLTLTHSITRTVERSAQPLLVAQSLLTNMPMERDTVYEPVMTSGLIGAASRVSPQGEPNSAIITFEATAGVKTEKWGLRLQFTEEVVQYSKWPVVQWILDEASREMARAKEVDVWQKVIRWSRCHIYGGATPPAGINLTPTARRVHGRDIAGALNGTMTLDDLFEMMAYMLTESVMPDMLIMNPWAWKIFATSPELRTFAMLNGGTLFKAPQGNIQIASWGQRGFATPNPELPHNATLYADIPSLFPQPLRIVVSPFIPYNPSTQTTTLIMAVNDQVGIYLDGGPVRTKEWEDPLHSITDMMLLEFWNVAPKNNGRYLVSTVEISTAKGYDWESKLVWDAGNNPLPS